VDRFLWTGGRLGQVTEIVINPAMAVAPVDRVNAVGELALHPFQVEQARTVDVFVEHAGRQCFDTRRRIIGSRC
jgi:hypothetical protein